MISGRAGLGRAPEQAPANAFFYPVQRTIVKALYETDSYLLIEMNRQRPTRLRLAHCAGKLRCDSYIK
jgi:hypothetical protein